MQEKRKMKNYNKKNLNNDATGKYEVNRKISDFESVYVTENIMQ